MYLQRVKRKNPETGQTAICYQIAWREGGRGSPQRSIPLGFVTEAEATRALQVAKARQTLGLAAAPPPTPAKRSSGPTLLDLWGSTTEPWPEWPACRMRDYYHARQVRPKTLRAADSARRAFLPFVGDLPVAQVTSAELDRLVIKLRQKGLKSKSIENYLVCLGTSLKLAHEDGLLARPVRLPVLSHDDAAEPIFLTPDEVTRLYAVLPDGPAGLLIRLTETLFTRSGESMHARWENMRGESGVPSSLAIRPCTLPDGTRWAPKTKPRTVAIPPELGRQLRAEWIRQGQPAAGWVFPGRDDPAWPTTDFRKSLTSACKRAGLPLDLHPHSLRHTGASRYAAAGATVAEIMEAGGWSSPEVPMRIYAHAHPDALASVAARAEAGADHPAGMISTALADSLKKRG